MFRKRFLIPNWRLMSFAVQLGICLGCFYSAFAQGPLPNVPSGSGTRSSNPSLDHRNHATITRVNDSAKLLSKAAAAAEKEKQRLIKEAIAAGNKARDENQYKLALESYEKVRGLDPEDERATYGMGNVYVDLYCNDSAIEAYVIALNRNPKYLEALIGLGNAYAAKERFDDAEAQFRLALAIRADSVEGQLGLGRVHLLKGKYQEAITQINLVINSPSVEVKDRASAHVALGDVYWKQNKRKEAIAQFEEAIRLKPDFAWAYVEIGNARSSVAASKVNYFTPNEVSIQNLEEMHSIAKQATANLEDARKYGYNHPQIHEYLALSLAYQTRYDLATAKLDEYFVEIKKLEDRLQSLAIGCGPGFNRLRAQGYLYRGYLSYHQGIASTNTARKNEFLSQAKEHFTHSITLQEDLAGSNSMLGHVYSILGKKEEAIELYKKAIRFTTEEPVKASLFSMIGTIYDSLGRRDEALQNSQEAIKRAPNNPEHYRTLAGIYISLGKLEDALEHIKKADALKAPDSTLIGNSYYDLGVGYGIRYVNKRNEQDFVEAVKALKKMGELRPRYAGSYDVLGGLYFVKGDATAALENYDKAFNLDPKNAGRYMNVGRVYAELKNNDDAAIESFKKALEVKPDLAWAYRHLGLLYHRRKDDAQAINHLQSAIKYDPKYLPSYLDLSGVYRKQKNYAEAIKWLTTAIGVAPTNPGPYQQLGLVYLDRKDADEALKNFNRAVEYDPNNSDNYLYLARVYSELKHEDEPAIKQLLKAIELTPKDPDLYSWLADIHRRRKNYPEAIKVLNTAITNAPNVPGPYKDLAKVYEAQKINGEAIRYYEEALKRVDAGDSSTKALYLGRIARLRGSYTEAIEYFRKVNDSDDDPGRSVYEIGVVYAVSKNKKAARAEYDRLKPLSASLAEDLLRQINEMK